MPNTKSISDDELIIALKTGNGIDKALQFIYKTYYQGLERWVLQNNGSKMDAEDLIQEVLLAFVDMIQKDKYRSEASVKSLLYSITRNLWITELRKRGTDSKRNEVFEVGREQVEEDISGYLIRKEAHQTIVDLFDQLGPRCKQILTLFYYENLSVKDILTQTNYENEQVLRNRKYKCLKTLTDMIQQSPTLSDTIKSALQSLK